MEAPGVTLENNCSQESIHKDDHHTPYTIIFLFGVFALGAFTRFLLKHIRLPYTVVLFVVGILLGLGSSNYEPLREYTALARISPHLILYIFLPILIFESAFALDAHTFTRCIVQCLLLAVPGLLIVTALTAVLSINLFTSYNWDWPTALLFGSILSATDPVAVVALLREIGASKTLSTLVEGESLLNDGSAIVAYAVLIELAVPGNNIDASGIVVKFCQISFGGPALGYVMGKISVFCLSRVFNDAMIEVTVTLSAAYITYYLAEAVLKVSGVLSLLALGVVISSEKDSISPEVEAFVHKFWEKLSYLANTVIFVIVGIVVAEAAADYIEGQDWFLVCATYIGSTVFRLVMIGMLSPALSRLGYGLSWQDGVVMTWGGLRGAVGLALALLVSETEGINKERVGNKILIHVSGIVLLTLLLNATSIKSLLKMLGMSDIPIWKRRIMAKAVKHLEENLERSIHVQKNNQFLADADWKLVDQITKIEDPYNTPIDDDDEEGEGGIELVRFMACTDCELQHVIPPTTLELEEMFDQARLRMLNAQKEIFWRQFENGLLAQENIRVLIGAAQVAADKDKGFINVDDLKIHWKVPAYYTWLKKHLELCKNRRSTGGLTSNPALHHQREPSESDRLKSPGLRAHLRRFLRLSVFDVIVYVIIILNLVPVVVELVILIGGNPDHAALDALHVANYVFVALYLSELTLKLVGFGPLLYWSSHWNKFDLLILTLTLIDTALTLSADITDPKINLKKTASLLQVANIIRLTRALRMLRMLKLLRPRLLSLVNSRINVWLYAGYDIGCGLMVSLDEVVKRIEDIIDYQPIVKQLQQTCEQSRVQIVRELALLQEEHPSVAVAVKTRHAARHVLNNSRSELNELKESGLLDDAVYDELMAKVEKKMKRLVSAPTSLLPAPPIELLQNIDWISDNEEIFNYIKSHAAVVKFPKGHLLGAVGNSPFGIYIITVGIIKIEGHVGPMEEGKLPNTDSFHWFSSQGYFEDFLTAGNVLGEMGILTRKPKATSAICETEVQAFFISQDSIERASSLLKLEYWMWRTCALRIAKTVLKNNPQYGEWSMSRIMMHLQRAYLPDLRSIGEFILESEMQDVILIQGRAKDMNTGEEYIGVIYIPRTVYSLKFEVGEALSERPLLVVIGSVDMGSYPQNWTERRQRWSLCPTTAQSRCLLHQVRRRSMMPLLAAPNRRTSRAQSKVSTSSRGSWVDSLADYLNEREGGYSNNVDLQEESLDPRARRRSQLILQSSAERRANRRISLQPSAELQVVSPARDISILVSPPSATAVQGSKQRREHTFSLKTPSDEEMQTSYM